MTRRLRLLLERPLDPATARVVLVLGGSVCVGFAVVLGLGLVGPVATGSPRSTEKRPAQDLSSAAARPFETGMARGAVRARRSTPIPQDPQDRKGNAAAWRAHRELSTHRALQHVPWRGHRVSISLAGAAGGKAILAVRGPSLRADRRGRQAFLRRYEDDGGSYLFRFTVENETPVTPALGGGRRR